MRKRKKVTLSNLAYRDNTVVKEDLPLPFAHYPGTYGAFFGFSKLENSPIFLCSCCKEAVGNYIKFRQLQESFNSIPTKRYILSSSNFPKALVEELMNQGVSSDAKVIDELRFENHLCHECNKKTPSLFYCYEMYGSSFKQKYGWYIKKKAYEMGISLPFVGVIPELCSQEVLDLINAPERLELRQKLNTHSPSDMWGRFKLKSELDKYNRKIENLVENEVRTAFGHKKVGEAWTSETILYYLVQSLFPNKTIMRHYRPSFLNGLELDIFIKEQNIGIEYQGIQHFIPIKHWGGEEGLAHLQKRDKEKQRLCKTLGIRIEYFKYDENLNDALVRSRIMNL